MGRFRHCRHLRLQTRMDPKHHAAPQFFQVPGPPGEGAPRGPPAADRFATRPRKGPSPISNCALLRFLHNFGVLGCSLSNLVQQAWERGPWGLGWVEHSHTESLGITEPLRLDFRGAPCLCFTHLAGPASQKRPSQPRQGPREAKNALPGRFPQNCGESTISVGRFLGLAQDFCGRGLQCGLVCDPVAAPHRVEGPHRGRWGV